MATTTLHRITDQEYFELESSGEDRHELIDGEVYVMPGVSFVHAQVGGNLIRSLGNRLLERPCVVLTCDARVKVGSSGAYLFPDTTVACGEPDIQRDGRQQTVLNPLVVFEILSATSEQRDRGPKLAKYQQVESLQAYVLIDQYAAIVERYERSEGRDWRYARHEGLDQEVEIACLKARVPLSEIYYQVKFEAASLD